MYNTDEPCLCCGVYTENGNCYHHIKTRKSGGTDDAFNLMPLCQRCHNYFHSIPLSSITKKNVVVKGWLEANGWVFEYGKWRHYGG
jgi:5-methylcytosine-specific restriction endonuclease McrA